MRSRYTQQPLERREDAMTDQPDVLYDVKDRIATITLNRPERLNAYNAHMAQNIKLEMAKAASDSDVRVIVLTGAGRGFCAGADMEVLSSSAAGQETSGAVDSGLDRKFESALGPDLSPHFKDSQRFAYFARTKKPIIAAINGPAAGIGLVMALYADMRFAAEKAVFTTSFRATRVDCGARHQLAVAAAWWGRRMRSTCLMSARKISAEEAQRIGLVNRTFPQENFMDNVRAYARHLAETVSPRSMAVMKAQVWKSNFQDFNESLATADAEMKTSLAGPEFKEGVAHFLEKRAPRFADI
jgi:enoyl-CoA hydratase/carnithine racemase